MNPLLQLILWKEKIIYVSYDQKLKMYGFLIMHTYCSWVSKTSLINAGFLSGKVSPWSTACLTIFSDRHPPDNLEQATVTMDCDRKEFENMINMMCRKMAHIIVESRLGKKIHTPCKVHADVPDWVSALQPNNRYSIVYLNRSMDVGVNCCRAVRRWCLRLK